MFDLCVKRMPFLHDPRIDIYFNTWNTTHYFIPGFVDITEQVTTERILAALNNRTHPDSKIVLSVSETTNDRRHQFNLIYSWINGVKMIKNSGISYDHILLIRPDILFANKHSITIDDFLVSHGNLGITTFSIPSHIKTRELRNRLLRLSGKTITKQEDVIVNYHEEIETFDNTQDRMKYLSEHLKPTPGIHDLFFSAAPDIINEIFNDDMMNLWLSRMNHWHNWINQYLFTFDIPKVYIAAKNSEIMKTTICRLYADENISIEDATKMNVDWCDLKHYRNYYSFYLNGINYPNASNEKLVRVIKQLGEGYYDKYRVSKTTQQ